MPRSDLYKTKLAFQGSCNHQTIQPFASTFILLPFPLPVVTDQFLAYHRNGRIMPQTLLLQGCIFQFVAVFIFCYLQLSLTLHAHLEFFAVESDAFFQAFQFVVVGKGLLFQVQTFLFHFNLLLLIGNHLLFPLVALVFNITKQIGIGKNKNSVSLLKQTSLFTDNSFHTSCFTGIDLDG